MFSVGSEFGIVLMYIPRCTCTWYPKSYQVYSQATSRYLPTSTGAGLFTDFIVTHILG